MYNVTLQIKFEGNSNHAGWAQQNGFGLAFLHSFAEANNRHSKA
jgi:hypothetical protein